jgi:type VI secretion system Hcp family effector
MAAVAGLLLGSVLAWVVAGTLRPAQAAPVPAAQASCPPNADPRPVAMTSAGYARVDGITGDATRTGVAGQIVLTSVRTAVQAGASGLCGGAGTPALDPIVVEKRVDRASVVLLSRASTGQHIATATISVWTESGTPRQFLSYDLADVVVSYVRQVQRTDSLTEEVAFSFARITWRYVVQNPDGSNGATIQACWDRVRNVSC